MGNAWSLKPLARYSFIFTFVTTWATFHTNEMPLLIRSLSPSSLFSKYRESPGHGSWYPDLRLFTPCKHPCSLSCTASSSAALPSSLPGRVTWLVTWLCSDPQSSLTIILGAPRTRALGLAGLSLETSCPKGAVHILVSLGQDFSVPKKVDRENHLLESGLLWPWELEDICGSFRSRID
jgi:hypothetical protein